MFARLVLNGPRLALLSGVRTSSQTSSLAPAVASKRLSPLAFGPCKSAHRSFSTTFCVLHDHGHSHAAGAGHSHGHSHSHGMGGLDDITSDEASEDIYLLDNSAPKPTVMSKVKDFFNPHKPIHQIMGADTAGHSHDHTHLTTAEAEELTDPSKLANKGVRITWIGFCVNASMAVIKFIGGVYFHSQSLIADAVHSFSDLISDCLTLTTVRFANKPPTKMYPLGFGKVETFGSLLVSAILLYAGLSIGFSSFFSIVGPMIPDSWHHALEMLPFHSHSHNHLEGLDGTAASDGLQVANINAAWLALGSIIVKEWLFRVTNKVGQEMNSKVLIANAWHHRVDSLTSVVALVTISTGYFFNIYWMDSVGGMIVSMLIIKVGISGVFQSFKELIDKAIPQSDSRYTDIEDSINVKLMDKDPNLLIKELSILPSGTNMNVVLKLGVSSFNSGYESELTLDKMGSVAHALRQDLKHDFQNVKNVSVQYISNSEKDIKPIEEDPKDEQAEVDRLQKVSKAVDVNEPSVPRETKPNDVKENVNI